AVHDIAAMRDVVADSLRLERLGSLMMAFFAWAALLMATLGIYGVISYAVRQRRVEIGTRMALGAVRSDVLSLVIGGGLKLTAWGIAVGLVAVAAASWLLTRYFDTLTFGWLPVAFSAAVVTTV